MERFQSTKTIEEYKNYRRNQKMQILRKEQLNG